MTRASHIETAIELLEAGIMSPDQVRELLELEAAIRRSTALMSQPKWIVPAGSKVVRRPHPVVTLTAEQMEASRAPVCDCGAVKCRTTHEDWCSTARCV